MLAAPRLPLLTVGTASVWCLVTLKPAASAGEGSLVAPLLM